MKRKKPIIRLRYVLTAFVTFLMFLAIGGSLVHAEVDATITTAKPPPVQVLVMRNQDTTKQLQNGAQATWRVTTKMTGFSTNTRSLA
jgi:hypothetical protein